MYKFNTVSHNNNKLENEFLELKQGKCYQIYMKKAVVKYFGFDLDLELDKVIIIKLGLIFSPIKYRKWQCNKQISMELLSSLNCIVGNNF